MFRMDPSLFKQVETSMYEQLNLSSCFPPCVEKILDINKMVIGFLAKNCQYYLPIDFNICFGCFECPQHNVLVKK